MSATVESIIGEAPFFTFSPQNTAEQAIQAIAKFKPAALVIVHKDKVVGTLSDREILSKVIFQNLDPRTTAIEGIMTPVTHTVKTSTSATECLEIMKKSKLRQIPVVGGWFDKPAGIISNKQVILSLVGALERAKQALDSAEVKGEGQFEYQVATERLKVLVSKQEVLDISVQETAMEAIQIMSSFNIGCTLVTDNGQLVGVFGERDVITRVMSKNLKPNQTKIREVMTSPVTTVDVSTSVESCLAKMNSIGCRHLPVMNEAKIAGVVSIVDCLNWIYEDMLDYNTKKAEWLSTMASTGM